MHELSIAMQLVDVAARAAEDAGAERVSVVRLRLGALSGVVRDALEFSFAIVAADTALAGAQLQIEELPLVIYCVPCARKATLVGISSFRCPSCNTPSGDIRQGRELEIVGLEIMGAGVAQQQPLHP
ncbi:hydrogenase maturation nickel metallochaperone HypA [Candidatus Gracilibacteria bacterium]|nr:hydrogenase maturation nickel metallochaperone HypA [Candidatus Gracilibacteria bacterium]